MMRAAQPRPALGPGERRLAAYFDRLAEEGVMAEFLPEEEVLVARMLERWRIGRGDRVVEPGCGSGRLTARLAEAVGPAGVVFALDLSERMLARARARGLPAHATLRRASVREIPAANSAFDHAVCFHALPHFEDLPAALTEIVRVLRPGGRLWIDHLSAREQVNAVHASGGSEISGHLLPEVAEVREMLAAAGLEVIASEDGPASFSLSAVRPASLLTASRA